MKKGFTLIELLAVILILGIIALIAIPQVTNVIGNASKGAAETSAKHYVDAVTNKIALSKLQSNPSEKLNDGVYKAEDISVDITGEGPTSGTIVIDDGMVKYANVEVNGYTVTCNSNGKCHAAQYVYFQQLEEFTSFNQTVPEIPTEYKAYLRINKDDITDLQSCFNDEGKELCFSPYEYEESVAKASSFFKFDVSDGTWEYEGAVEGKYEYGYFKEVDGRDVEVLYFDDDEVRFGDYVVWLFIYEDGSIVTADYMPWFNCYYDTRDDTAGCWMPED